MIDLKINQEESQQTELMLSAQRLGVTPKKLEAMRLEIALMSRNFPKMNIRRISQKVAKKYHIKIIDEKVSPVNPQK